jgi:hypothetical protein
MTYAATVSNNHTYDFCTPGTVNADTGNFDTLKVDGNTFLGGGAAVAMTQTYSTAATTVAAVTTHAIADSSGGSVSTSAIAAITGGGANCENAAKNAIATLAAEAELLKADLLADKKVINKIIDVLQAHGLMS